MRKLLIFLGIVVLLFVAGFFVLRSFLPSTAEMGDLVSFVPKDASFVAVVDYETMSQMLAKEAFRNPSQAADLSKKFKSASSGLEFPSGLAKYMLKSGGSFPEKFVVFAFDNGVLATLLPITDYEKLDKNLDAEAEKSGFSALDENQFYHDKAHLGLKITEGFVLAMYHPELSQDQVGQCWEMAKLSNKQEGNRIQNILDETEQITFEVANPKGLPDAYAWLEDMQLRASILVEEEQIKIVLKSQGETPLFIAQNAVPIKAQDSSFCEVALAFNAAHYPISKIMNIKLKHDTDTGLGKDQMAELEKYWNGQLSFSLGGPKSVETEIISYDYNDDFEKVESKTTAVVNQPVFDGFFGFTNPSDGDKFRAAGWVEDRNGAQVLKPIEIQDVECETLDEGLLFFSNTQMDGSQLQQKGKAVVNWRVSEMMEAYPKMLPSNLKNIGAAIASIKGEEKAIENGTAFEFTIQFQEDKGGAILQLAAGID